MSDFELPTFGDPFGDEDEDADELLQALVAQDVSQGKPKAPRFYCAGAKRTDPWTDKKVCNYKSFLRWEGACPQCNNWFGCMRIARKDAVASRVSLSAETMASAKELVYYSTGIPELDKVIGGGVVMEKTLLVGAEAGSGKPLACNTPVPTPTGWSTQGELRAGDEVIGADGRLAKVIGTTGVIEGRDCYRLYFSDGSSMVSDGVHPWSTLTSNERSSGAFGPERSVVRSTREIAETLHMEHSIEAAYGPLTIGRMPTTARSRRYIVAIERVPSVPVCCISTDRPDGLYIAGEQWIVTHNTTLLLQVCDGFAKDGRKAYFASGEMTRDAVLAYAKRLGITNGNVGVFGNPEGVDVEELFPDVLAFGAQLIVLDSVQVAVCRDVKGDIGQVTMMDAVTNMVTSFAQKKKRSVLMIGHFEKTANFAGSEKMRHLVDGLIRMDKKYVGYDSSGKPIDSMIREISMDGKSRQGRSDVKTLIEMTDNGMRPPSLAALKKIKDSVLQLV